MAAACTLETNKTIIKVFDMLTFEQTYTLFGHKNIIHDLKWSTKRKRSDPYFLVSSSSDFNAIVWKIPKKETESEEYDEDDSRLKNYCCTLNHPGYVYAASFLPKKHKKTSMIVVTICFDSKIRVWEVRLDKNTGWKHEKKVTDDIWEQKRTKQPSDNILDYRYPISLVFEFNSGRLFIGDSLGSIYELEIQIRGN